MNEEATVNNICINEFDIYAAFENEGYISSIDLLNNIIATTNTKNIIKIYDLNERKEKLTYRIEDVVINDIKLLKRFKEKSGSIVDYDVEECLFAVYENNQKCKIYHFNIINKKIIHIFEFSNEIVDNSFVLHPNTHIFIVTLRSKELLVYHIKDKTTIYKTNIQNENCIASYNKTGIIYAYTFNVDTIYLCSCFGDDYNDEYFANFDISKITNNNNFCTHIDFSFDEKKMLIATKYNYIYTLDAYTGDILYAYNYIYESNMSHLSFFLSYPIYSFDSNFILSGGKDGYLHVWSIKGNYVCKKKIGNNIMFVKWIYNRVAFITTSNFLLIWQPSKKDENKM
ncbi:conserved Plasmodium protein, unknown function [Plasmodium gallinaceum]|uniref:WD repeat-containing protein n=1 Tax=Plasmodium gallinaceum TaxID=5849 RepID=A0A1J1GUJ8_PLAGA|nr:conserved Plasmodium protein, unknown function [Plasmodium gallinaceum]CRG94984.1 conserved Plasmodium protein, unknown function [Plasmodium gallinaceum]